MNRMVFIGLVLVGCGGGGFSVDLSGDAGAADGANDDIAERDAGSNAGGSGSGGVQDSAGGQPTGGGSGGVQAGAGGVPVGAGGAVSSGGSVGTGGASGADGGADAASGGAPGAGGSATGSGTVKVGGACTETFQCVPMALIPAAGCVCPAGYPWCKTTVECVSGHCYNARTLGCCAGTDCGL